MLKINNMKKTFRYVLMAVLTVGLSFAATSCKDDDKDNGGGENMEQLESTGGTVSLEDIQLSTLISNFAEVQADELLAQSGWQSKTYEATLGLVLDESRPTVRTIEVGTVDAADERAEAMLRELGIDGQSPSGFTFSNASVGTVSYQHGGGTDANTLAVINLDVRQLPSISQLRMVKALPANVMTFAYYDRGDIVQKNGRLWICTTPAMKKGDYAYFVSFWTNHRTDNCRWGTYKDMVYLAKDEMASGHDLISWLHNFVMWDEGYNYIIRCLREKGITHEDDVQQLLPPTNDIRRELIKRLHFGLDSLPVSPLTMPEWIERNKWGDTPKSNGRYCAPRSMLLANKFRYAIDPCRYWVPFIGWATVEEAKDIDAELSGMKSQNAKTNSNHFQFEVSSPVNIRDNQTKQDYGDAYKCQYVLASVYWTHNYYNSNQWAMFDFTKDWNEKEDVNNTNTNDASPWLSRNIVSGTLKFKDNGEPNTSVHHVWVAREDDLNNNPGDDTTERPDYVEIDEEKVQVFKVIGKDGEFYNNTGEANANGGGAIALVVYTGGENRVEKGTAYNGLAISLEQLNTSMTWGDDSKGCKTTVLTGNAVATDYTGLASTKAMAAGCGQDHNHDVMDFCYNQYATHQRTDGKKTFTMSVEGERAVNFSRWFVPSYGQWQLAMQGLCNEGKYTFNFSGDVPSYEYQIDSGMLRLATMSDDWYNWLRNVKFWSTTVAPDGDIYLFTNNAPRQATDWMRSPGFDSKGRVIPFIAFVYGPVETQDQ